MGYNVVGPMALGAEYAVFSILMAMNFGLGIYFSLPRKDRMAQNTSEVFLGSRALRALPLAASMVASLISSTGLVGLTGHFYAYGFHFMWTSFSTAAVAPLATWLFLPVLYELRVTSVFEYIRLRFCSAIATTTCVIYILLTQSIGALSIYAASLTIVTVFGAPLMWCNIAIGLCGTLYTTLGGLRGVVWTDCMQLFFIVLGPTTVVAKIIIDWNSSTFSPQPLTGFDLRPYIANLKFDLTHDETMWASVSSLTTCLYRVGMDQVVVQRCMASRTLASAKRTVYIGVLLLIIVNIVKLALAVALVLWFRGCDPQLSGAITSHDQILPFYIKTYLLAIPGFTGLFLAAVVSAATSTISSVINSQAAVVYMDILSPRFKKLQSGVTWMTRGLSLFLGLVMTFYSCVCVYMGSVTRAIFMVNAAAAGPCLGLLILAVAFPFVHSKGAGISTLVMFAVQLVLLGQRIHNGLKPPLMPVTLDYCQGNGTYFHSLQKHTAAQTSQNRAQYEAAFTQLSPFWSGVLSTIFTVVLGVIISAVSGEHRKRKPNEDHSNRSCVKILKKLGIVQSNATDRVQQGMQHNDQVTTTLL